MRLCIALICCALACASIAFANHGPGTSGGGSSTVSGETLKKGTFELSLREDYTEFEHISRDEAERRALKSGEFDAISRSFIESFSLAYGITSDLQIGASIGWYNGVNFIDAESENGIESESGKANPSGLTDLNLNAKLRILRGQPGNLSLYGGVIAPTGNNDVRLDNGELLEPSSQPGTGAWNFQIGFGYSRFLTSHITIDASSVYTFRTRDDGFKVGDRWDNGVALAYRLTDSIQQFPNYSVFLEATDIWIGQDDEEHNKNPNSGGNSIYLTPGFRVRFDPHAALTIAPAFPVVQNLMGDQIEAQFKLAITLSISF